MRNSFYQSIRGLCICLVVLIHLPLGQETGNTSFLSLEVRQIINYPVALFFFLSGYFLNVGDSVKDYILKRLKRLLIPYLLFSVFYIIVLPYIKDRAIEENAFFYFLTGYGPLYFLLVLIQLTILCPLIINYGHNPIFKVLSFSLSIAYILFLYVYNHYYGILFPAYQSIFLAWYCFYYFGYCCRDNEFVEFLRNKISIDKLLWIITFLLILEMIESFTLQGMGNFSFAASQLKLSSCCYAFTIILIVVLLEKKSYDSSLFSKIGDYSMGIFMLHPFFNWVYMYFFMVIFPIFSYNDYPDITLMNLSIWLLSISSSLLFSLIVDRISSKYARIIGLK